MPTQKHHKVLTREALDGVVEFCGDLGTFDLEMSIQNFNVETITYAKGAAGRESPPKTFTPNTGPTGSVTATLRDCAAAPDASTDLFATPVAGRVVIVFSAGLDNYSPITVSGLTNGVSDVCLASARND